MLILGRVTVATALTAILAVGAAAQQIYLDHVSPEYLPGKICTQSTVDFWFHVTAGGVHNIECMDNGFRLYSPDGAQWGATVPDTIGTIGRAQFDLIYWITARDVDGSGSDTIAFSGIIQYEDGLDLNFDDTAWKVSIGPINPRFDRTTICLDSCWFPPADIRWVWSYIDDQHVLHECPASWGGPYCFQVVHPCCAVRGDIDHSGTGPDIADLVYLVTYMFQSGPEPPCMEEADINSDAAMYPDISDLVYIVTYMFQDGPPMLPCPPGCP